MLKVKKQVNCGIFISTMLVMLVGVSVQAGAVNSTIAAGGGQVQDSSAAPEIKLEIPSEVDPQTQGRADIEKSFPTIENSDANGEKSAAPQVSESTRESSQELPIVYGQQQDKETTESDTSTGTEAIENPWNMLLLLAIPVIIVLIFAALYIKKSKKKEEVYL